ncbi:siphovirus Gp157 family protein [Senegalia massiliensis]|uniref:siphovirus Gp157 family protein n=1 Tax=Senegalia massiliensis TaxID=1720316 RepID=UPI001031E5A2|nr:siphovirus Gp157 family protein [Senegalia massiliensis]
MKLYELTETYNNILNLLEDDDAEVEGLEKALEQLEEDINVKAENIAKLVKNIESDINSIKEEEKRLRSKKNTLQNKVKSLKDYLYDQLKATGNKKVKTPLFSVWYQNNAPSLEIVDEYKIPDEFIEYEKKILTRDILNVIKSGLEVEGVNLKQTESLRIR